MWVVVGEKCQESLKWSQKKDKTGPSVLTQSYAYKNL